MPELKEFFSFFKNTAKREPSKLEVAGHLADRISAMEQQQRNARQQGDFELLDGATSEITKLRSEAKKYGLDPNDFPGIYH